MSDTGCKSRSKEKREDKNSESDVPPEGKFKCHICSMTETYHYYGRKPPFKKGIIFLEDAFIAKDPFAPAGKSLFLLLGSLCSVCNQSVCQSQECSMFYAKRFCLPCVQSHYEEFPPEVKKDIDKILSRKKK